MQQEDHERINLEQQQPVTMYFPKKFSQSHKRQPKQRKLIDAKLKQTIQYASLKARDMADRFLARAIRKKVQQIVIRLLDNKSQASLIIVIHVQRNQVQQLERFMEHLSWTLEGANTDVISSQQAEKLRRCQYKNTDEVRELILKMHNRLDFAQQGKSYIFLPHKVTDLTEKNLYLFKKGLAGARYKLVIATFNDLQNEAVDRQSTLGLQIEVYYAKLFNAKTLFVEFMWNCLFNEEIKAYLPKQCIDLISDYDYYPLSYKCGVSRLIYLIKQNIMLNGRQVQFVNLNAYIKPIQQALYNLCPGAFEHQKTKIRERIITTILTTGEKSIIPEKKNVGLLQNNPQSRIRKEHIDDRYRFTIPPLFQNSYRPNSDQTITQLIRSPQFFIQIRRQIARQYEKQMERQQQQGIEEFDYQWCIDQLAVQQDKAQNNSRDSKSKKSTRNRKINKPRNDFERYQIGKQQIRMQGLQGNAQKKITQIIRKSTQGVRQQTKKFKWQDYQFQWRIRPQLPRQIVANLISYTSKSKDPRMKTMNHLVTVIISNYAIDLKKFVQENNYKQANYGELMSIIKDFEILGILEKSVRLSQLIFTNNFYHKSVYRARN